MTLDNGKLLILPKYCKTQLTLIIRTLQYEIALRSQPTGVTYIELPYQQNNKSNKQKLRTFNSYCIIWVQHILYVTQSLTTFNKRWISWSVTFNSAVTSTVLAGSSCLDISRTPFKQFSLIYPLLMFNRWCWFNRVLLNHLLRVTCIVRAT